MISVFSSAVDGKRTKISTPYAHAICFFLVGMRALLMYACARNSRLLPKKSVKFRITAAFFSLCCHHCRRLRHRRRCHHQSTANIAAAVAVVTHHLRHCPPKLLQNSFPLFNSLVFDFYRLCASFALLRTTRIWWSTIWFLPTTFYRNICCVSFSASLSRSLTASFTACCISNHRKLQFTHSPPTGYHEYTTTLLLLLTSYSLYSVALFCVRCSFFT